MGIELGSLGRTTVSTGQQQALSTTKPSLQPQDQSY